MRFAVPTMIVPKKFRWGLFSYFLYAEFMFWLRLRDSRDIRPSTYTYEIDYFYRMAYRILKGADRKFKFRTISL